MKQKKEELVSLNSEVTEFELQELESRLETDPLAVGGLVDMISTGNTSFDLASSDELHIVVVMSVATVIN